METRVSSGHRKKAHLSIDSTEFGIVISVSLLWQKALLAIEVMPSGIIVFLHPNSSVLVDVWMIALQSFRESYIGFSAETMMLHKPLHCSNAPLPIEVTEAGIIMLFSPVQEANEQKPICVIVLGIMKLTRLPQLRKTPALIYVIERGIVKLFKLWQP